MTKEECKSLQIDDEVWCSSVWEDDGEFDTCHKGRITSKSYDRVHVLFPHKYHSFEVFYSSAHRTKEECIEYKIKLCKDQIEALEKFKTSDNYEW